MKSANRRFIQKAIAIVVIVTLLYGAGVAPVVMLFISGVVFVVFLVSRRAQAREVERIFDFYVAAEAILRHEDRRWYGFEVAEVIEDGEDAVEGMPDPPPLQRFTLGALHHLVEHHTAAANYLTSVIEDENSDERHYTAPSAQLRRYVSLFRKIELDPSIAPQTLGAIRSLERMRRKDAFRMLTESRKALEIKPIADNVNTEQSCTLVATGQTSVRTSGQTSGLGNSQLVAPPPIRDVLNDIYQDEHTTSN